MRRVLWSVFVGLAMLPSADSASAQSYYSFSFGTGWPAYGSWSAPYPYPYPYGYYGPYYPGPVILPPLFLPAESMYGPLAMRRFMGLDTVPAQAPPVIIANRPANNNPAPVVQGPVRPKVRITNAAMKAQAGKFMAFGDANFAKQNYNSALERYRTAAQTAPDVAEAYLRQGFALVAIGNYDSAARAMRRALLLQNDPAKFKLRLDNLYGENQMAKTAHLEALARAVENNELSADLLLLLGLQLYFDNQADRARPVFQRCEQLGGNDDGAIIGFLEEAAPAENPGNPGNPGRDA